MGKARQMKTQKLGGAAGYPAWRARINDHLTNWVLPLGILLLLTSMMWAGEKRLFQQLFYVFLALPAFVLALNCRDLAAALLRSPVFIAFLCFAAYFSISISWSGTDESVLSLLKRPLYVLSLFFAFAGVAFHRPDRLTAVLRLSSIIAVVAASVQLAFFLLSDDGARLAGYGALHNPLLTSHVFGFFLVLWIAYWIHHRRFFLPVAMIAVAVLGALILATGSRTPLLALSATILWLGLMTGDRRGVIAFSILVLAGGIIAVLWPEAIAQRGLSYRPQIWAEAIRQALEFPTFGHGYNHALRIQVEGINYAFSDPHNMTLSVFYRGGALGLVFWAALFASALFVSWKNRKDVMIFAFSATIVYGLVASMTEGGSFLSRPKEHWFLLWIPFALLTAATLRRRENEGTGGRC